MKNVRSITLYIKEAWYKVFWQVLVLNTKTNRKFLAIATDVRERERERGGGGIVDSLRLSTFVFLCFSNVCVCVCVRAHKCFVF